MTTTTAAVGRARPGHFDPDAHFTTRELCVLGAAGAASFVLMFLKLPVPWADFLKYDPSDVPPVLCAMTMGPGAGLMTVLVRVLLRMMTSAGDPIGLCMNLVASGTFVSVAGMLGRMPAETSKQIKALLVATAAMTLIMIPVNLCVLQAAKYVPAGNVVHVLILAITPFNIIKGFTNGVFVLLLGRRLRVGLKPFTV